MSIHPHTIARRSWIALAATALCCAVAVGTARAASAPSGPGPKLDWKQRTQGLARATKTILIGHPTKIPDIPEPKPGPVIPRSTTPPERGADPPAGGVGMHIVAVAGDLNQKKTWVHRASANLTKVEKAAQLSGGADFMLGCEFDASPDGKQLALIVKTNDPRRSQKYVYRLNSDGTGLKQLTTYGRESQVAFSPDGRRLAYLSNKASHNYPGLHVMNPDGSGQRPRPGLEHSYDCIESWSPDGQSILFGGDRQDMDGDPGQPGRCELYVLSLRDWKVRQLTRRQGGAVHAAYSPDGRKIAFVGYTDNAKHIQEVFVMNADGSGQRQITRLNRGFVQRPVWTPDGARIYFLCMQGNSFAQYRMYSVQPDGRGASMNTKPLPTNLKSGSISPSGQQVAYVVRSRTEASLNLWEASSGKSKQLLKVNGKSADIRVYWTRRTAASRASR
ncbi:PD40 domain-containing protein [bacterium]|nr:PD40 domain-containing protein [bacterium]